VKRSDSKIRVEISLYGNQIKSFVINNGVRVDIKLPD